MTMTCTEIRDLVPSFVLGALEASEMAAVREHLATCVDAHEEMEQLGGVVGYLGEAVEQIEPPDGLGARILAAAAAELRQPQIVADADADAGAVAGASGPAPAHAPTQIRDVRERRGQPPSTTRRPRPLGTWAMGLAAVLAIAVLGASTLVLQGRLDASERYAQAVADVVTVAAEPGSQTAILLGDVGGPTGIAAVRADGSIILAMRDLAPTSGTEVYEAWVIVGDTGPVPVGGFTVGSDGTGTLKASATVATAGATLALTREPAPGATTPTLPIVSVGVAVAPPG